MSVKKVGNFNFRIKGGREKAKRRIGILLARNTEKFFKDNFDRGGFLDRSLKRWERGRKERGKTLVDGGDLRNSIDVTKMSFTRIEIETVGIPYAYIHNYGGMTGRGRKTEMPKRQFMGHSHTLDKQNFRIIKRELKKAV